MMTEPYYTLDGIEVYKFYGHLAMSGLLGISLTMFALLAYQVCEPLTVNVGGIIKDIV